MGVGKERKSRNNFSSINNKNKYISVRMAIINKSTNNKARLWRKGNPSALLVGMQTGAATVENSIEFPQKTKNGTAF